MKIALKGEPALVTEPLNVSTPIFGFGPVVLTSLVYSGSDMDHHLLTEGVTLPVKMRIHYGRCR